MAKTLVDFRAEQGLYLKDLAAILEISEDELRTIEASGTVPAETGTVDAVYPARSGGKAPWPCPHTAGKKTGSGKRPGPFPSLA